ncbi:taste receptor type 2 member 40-like [Spea bombifrons]|uniref:taste receptor type 2 member 40-like n=1 Tax=Spea bombifrons TaxID=233779 RepID=UPI00234AA07F|nr:taste receptor type 2 member 40-like [Spea bombifrons]
MITAVGIVLLTIDAVILAASGSCSLFIFAVDLLDLINTKKLKLTDQLIFGISISGILFALLKIYRHVALVFMWGFIFDVNNGIMLAFYMMLMSFNLWFCTWLCLHFCLKIVNVNNGFYIFLQRRFFKMFPWLYFPSVMGSLLVAIPFAWYGTNSLQMNTTRCDTIGNGSLTYMTSRKQSNFLYAYLVASTLGFVLCSASVVTIIFSLYGHVKKMRLNSEGSRMPTMKAHVHAAKTVASLLFQYIILFTILIIVVFKVDELLCDIFSIITSVSHLICFLNLIKGNMKLDKALRNILARCPFHGVFEILA